MFGLFSKDAPPAIARLDAARSEEAAAVHAACFTYAWRVDELETLLTSASSYADGAFDRDGDLLGFILSRVAADEAEILTIAVKPRRRGQGIAGRLMEANMRQLQVAGARTWFLEVEAQNAPALGLYRRFGFIQVGERKSYYRTAEGTAATALILRRSLA